MPFFRNAEEPFGWHYLLSLIVFGGSAHKKLISYGAYIRLDDQRVKELTDFLSGAFGQPDQIYAPGARSGEELNSFGFLWKESNCSVFLEVDYLRHSNALAVTLTTQDPDDEDGKLSIF